MIPPTTLQHNHFHKHKVGWLSLPSRSLSAACFLWSWVKLGSLLTVHHAAVCFLCKTGEKLILKLQSGLNSYSFHWQAVTCTVAANSWNLLLLLFRSFGNIHSSQQDSGTDWWPWWHRMLMAGSSLYSFINCCSPSLCCPVVRYTEHKYKCNTFRFAPIFHELNLKI